jgi:UDP-N-acetylmuramoyl-tripeptide--D-alanyl-D-alanine ligase
VIRLTLAEVADATGGRVIGDPTHTVDAIATDTRAMPDGDPLFVALRGEEVDGHRFLADALDRGAAALVERADGDPPSGLVVVDDTWQAVRDLAVAVRARVAPRAVAITGSVGKTTVKDLTAAAARSRYRVASARGSFNNELGVPLTLLGLREDDEVLVAEIGARHVGDIADLAPLVAPEVAIVTAVAGVHLEIFGSIDAIERAKRELVEALGPGGVAVLNAADPRVAAMASHAPSVLTVGAPGADLTAEDVRLDASAHPTFTARTPWGDTEVRVGVAGRHQVGNALLALAAAGHLGVDVAAAASAIGGATVSPWRGEVVRRGGLTVCNDAYNANPTSVVAALETLVALRGDVAPSPSSARWPRSVRPAPTSTPASEPRWHVAASLTSWSSATAPRRSPTAPAPRVWPRTPWSRSPTPTPPAPTSPPWSGTGTSCSSRPPGWPASRAWPNACSRAGTTRRSPRRDRDPHRRSRGRGPGAHRDTARHRLLPHAWVRSAHP